MSAMDRWRSSEGTTAAGEGCVVFRRLADFLFWEGHVKNIRSKRKEKTQPLSLEPSTHTSIISFPNFTIVRDVCLTVRVHLFPTLHRSRIFLWHNTGQNNTLLASNNDFLALFLSAVWGLRSVSLVRGYLTGFGATTTTKPHVVVVVAPSACTHETPTSQKRVPNPHCAREERSQQQHTDAHTAWKREDEPSTDGKEKTCRSVQSTAALSHCRGGRYGALGGARQGEHGGGAGRGARDPLPVCEARQAARRRGDRDSRKIRGGARQTPPFAKRPSYPPPTLLQPRGNQFFSRDVSLTQQRAHRSHHPLTTPLPPQNDKTLTPPQQFPGRERLNRALQSRGLHQPGVVERSATSLVYFFLDFFASPSPKYPKKRKLNCWWRTVVALHQTRAV